MSKPIVVAISALTFLVSAMFIIPYIQTVQAQYTGPDTGGAPVTIEEQLKLARDKISNAQQSGAYGSGTPMFSTNIGSTIIFIAIIVVIFGGVAAAFFAMSRSKGGRKQGKEASHEQFAGGDAAFCSNCGTKILRTSKFCSNCGTAIQLAS